MKTIEQLKSELDAADAVRLAAVQATFAITDETADDVVARLNAAYEDADAKRVQAQRAWDAAVTTPDMLRFAEEQKERNKAQLESRRRLAQLDARTPTFGKTQAQLDHEYDEQLKRNQE